MNSLDQFLKDNKSDMLENLTLIVAELKRGLSVIPSDYLEHGCDEPTIDIRLCIDPNERNGYGFDWLFRVGSSDYDPYHSRYCAGSCVGIDTSTSELLDELNEDILEQEAMQSYG